MNREIKEALDTFASLLPDYLPTGPGNPNDLSRWHNVCYLSAIHDHNLTEEEIQDALKKHHSQFADECIAETAHNCHEEYESLSALLEYLKKNNLLVTNKNHLS